MQTNENRAHAIWTDADRAVTSRTDRLLAGLLLIEWVAAMAVAAWFSPLAWAGLESSLHPNVFSGVLLGALIAVPAAGFGFLRPSATLSRHVIVGAQMLMTALLVHLAGGRSGPRPSPCSTRRQTGSLPC